MYVLWILGGILLLFGCCLRSLRRSQIRWTSEAFPESTKPLPNPNQGFYHIVRYTLSDETEALQEAFAMPCDYSAPLALLEINLKQFRKSPISENGLKQLQHIFHAWEQSPCHTKLILRFLYDWDGIALATEPDSLDLIVTHIEQVCPIVNRHCDRIFLMQGIFIGNWGEMHHSRFQDTACMETLIQHLHKALAPSIYLSVRTPTQWRNMNHVSELPSKFPQSNGSLMERLGLYNDGILGSESDLGTYQSTEAWTAKTREKELEFQNALCRFVPNGGEVVYHQSLSRLETAVASLRTMHVSYLNADYDSRVFDVWKNSVWKAKDAFHGCDGYHYIEAHLGYRYLIRACNMKITGARTLTLLLTLENSGFSSTYKPFTASIVCKQIQTGACICIPAEIDFRTLCSGERRTYSIQLPAKELAHGRYQIYLSITEEDSRQPIYLGNDIECTEHGYVLGQLEK